MDCRICMDDTIDKNNMMRLDCGHELCITCFDKLIKNLCPYCREIIDNKVEGNYNIEVDFDIYNDDDIYSISIEIDNIIPLSDLYYIEELYYFENSYDMNRHNRKKKKKNKKKNFTSNNNREPHERKKKKWKKTSKLNQYILNLNYIYL